ncbi:MAG: copper homeostasis protein CutC [Aureisphaera sp.]
MILEICANGYESAKIAKEAGAHRIELCENLSVGGVTPSQELIEKVLSKLQIETHVLIRPREGDFCYSEEELEQMVSDITLCRNMGCAGIVSGVLTPNGDLNHVATRRLIETAKGMEFTFHRAIDVSREPRQLLRETILMGVTRVLSSGTKAKATDGLSQLLEFQKIAKGQIQIMPGGGITHVNAALFKQSGFEMIHSSATLKNSAIDSQDLMQSQSIGYSDHTEIKKILAALA